MIEQNLRNPHPIRRASSIAQILILGFGLFSGIHSRAGGGAGSGCETSFESKPPFPRATGVSAKYLRQAVGALDNIRNKVEEWGVVTISAPVAVLDGTAFFVPPNIVSPEQLYKDALNDINASVRQAIETGVSNGFGMSAVPALLGVPPTAPVTAPAGSTATTTTNTTTVATPKVQMRDKDGKLLPEFAEPQKLTIGVTPSPTAGLTAFTAPFANLKDVSRPSKSVSAALREAQDNTLRQKLYSQMTVPQGFRGHSDVIFCIVQVSCNPGWRTQQNYTADVSANLEYADICKGDYVPRGAGRAPTVFSVLPLLDAQTIDMANSQREVTQLAFDLAASLPVKGVAVKARDVFQFVKRYSRDARSISPIPVVNSYSTGSTFGFRFSPSFLAMRDPAAKAAKPANVLLPTTFPALITVILHRDDLDYSARYLGTRQLGVLTHVHNRWHLKDRAPLWQFPKRLWTPMKRDTVAMEVDLAGDLATVYDAKDNYWDALKRDNPDAGWSAQYDELRRQLLALESKGLGRDWIVPLPPIPRAGQPLFPDAESERQHKLNEDLRKAADAARTNPSKPVAHATVPLQPDEGPKNEKVEPQPPTEAPPAPAAGAPQGSLGNERLPTRISASDNELHKTSTGGVTVVESNRMPLYPDDLPELPAEGDAPLVAIAVRTAARPPTRIAPPAPSAAKAPKPASRVAANANPRGGR